MELLIFLVDGAFVVAEVAAGIAEVIHTAWKVIRKVLGFFLGAFAAS